MNRPFAESCEQNRAPILAVLRDWLGPEVRSLLEVGSGTGQHAVYFAPEFPHLTWQPSDRAENLPGIQAWLDYRPSSNLLAPIALDVVRDPWPSGPFDAVFSANTAHILHEPEVAAMFDGVGRVLRPGGIFLLYGPFHIDGRPTAPSNARFDQWLRAQDPGMGVRDVVWLQELGQRAGLALAQTVDMPADNKILCWTREPPVAD
jgi:SAM-dependent methyltransferase